jgi:hypothetical protein
MYFLSDSWPDQKQKAPFVKMLAKLDSRAKIRDYVLEQNRLHLENNPYEKKLAETKYKTWFKDAAVIFDAT